jgi:hypothetical protein
MTIRKLLIGTAAALMLAISPAHAALNDQGIHSAATLSTYHGSPCGPLPAKSWRFLRGRFETLSGVQLIEQRLCLLQIERVKALGEPAVDRCKQFASLLRLALNVPEPRHAHRGA